MVSPVVFAAQAAGAEPATTPYQAPARQALADAGFTFEATLIADLSKNISGGVSSAGTFRHWFDFNMTLDLGALAGVEGATFFVDFQTKEGQDGSVETGDLQAYSNIDAPDFTALYEIWYQQVFLDGDLRVKLGKIDANADFGFVDFGGEFINSSPGLTPTAFTMPQYPDPAFGALAFAGENEGMYAGIGVFDGALQEGIPTGTRGPSTLFGDPADLFWIGEAGVKWGGASRPGRFAVGVWHHTGSFARFSGGRKSGATGFYAVLDQLLYKENEDTDDAQGLGLFAQLGLVDEDISAISEHVGVGVQWAGPIPGRDADIIGLMASRAGLSDEPGAGLTDDAELAVELFYKLHLGEYFSIKPDIQYIMNPGGAGLDDAWVVTLRAELVF
ncbi:MAG: carbohydrate porin [Planctomycetota bacterium]